MTAPHCVKMTWHKKLATKHSYTRAIWINSLYFPEATWKTCLFELQRNDLHTLLIQLMCWGLFMATSCCASNLFITFLIGGTGWSIIWRVFVSCWNLYSLEHALRQKTVCLDLSSPSGMQNHLKKTYSQLAWSRKNTKHAWLQFVVVWTRC